VKAKAEVARGYFRDWRLYGNLDALLSISNSAWLRLPA
jgi:hypothetical protein